MNDVVYVFWKVGGSSLFAMAVISSICFLNDTSKAGSKCSGRISAKGGTLKGVLQGPRKGLFIAKLDMKVDLFVENCLPTIPTRNGFQIINWQICIIIQILILWNPNHE